MRVRISDPLHLESLVDFLRRVELHPVTLHPDIVDVAIAPPRTDRELALYLLTWRAMNPGASLVELEWPGGAAP